MKRTEIEDLRKAFFLLLADACDEFKDYSTADILYSTLRKTARRSGQPINFIRELSDKELYQMADEMIFEEKNDI